MVWERFFDSLQEIVDYLRWVEPSRDRLLVLRAEAFKRRNAGDLDELIGMIRFTKET